MNIHDIKAGIYIRENGHVRVNKVLYKSKSKWANKSNHGSEDHHVITMCYGFADDMHRYVALGEIPIKYDNLINWRKLEDEEVAIIELMGGLE